MSGKAESNENTSRIAVIEFIMPRNGDLVTLIRVKVGTMKATLL